MPVVLIDALSTSAPPAHDRWAVVGAAEGPGLDPARRVADLGILLERAFDGIAAEWWALARIWSANPSAGFAHTPACVANASDMGLMMAWSRLIEGWAREAPATLVIAADPWVYRHLEGLRGVKAAGRRPRLWPTRLGLWCRGYLARTKVAAKCASARWQLRQGSRPTGGTWLMAYGHPASRDDGRDAYFGDLMAHLPCLHRILHVDCSAPRARQLAGERTLSLHGFGRWSHLLRLPFVRWRPRRTETKGPWQRLVDRAVARESGTGQAAMIAWQRSCQAAWLRAIRPRTVAWPWENHAWERAFVRACRQYGTRTVGYQHSVIGSRMLNYAVEANGDGMDSVPDRVTCSGPATLRRLAAWGMPLERLSVGGALRTAPSTMATFDPEGPVFVALPFDGDVAAQMVAAACNAARDGFTFLVKDHPMTPFTFDDSPGVVRTDRGFADGSGVRAVVFAATTVGLEAVLAGIPTLRFLPVGRLALDILPEGVTVPTATAESLTTALRHSPAVSGAHRKDIFAAVDYHLWSTLLRDEETRRE